MLVFQNRVPCIPMKNVMNTYARRRAGELRRSGFGLTGVRLRVWNSGSLAPCDLGLFVGLLLCFGYDS